MFHLNRTERKLAFILAGLLIISWGLVLLPIPHSLHWLRLLWFVSLLMLSLLLFLFGHLWYRYTRLKRLVGRPVLTEEAIFREYYADSGLTRAIVLSVWQHIGDRLRVPPGVLRPDDRLNDLCGVATWVDGDWTACRFSDTMLVFDLVEDAILAGAPEPGKLETIDDLVRYLASHWKKKAT